jgi:hypothetical protein
MLVFEFRLSEYKRKKKGKKKIHAINFQQRDENSFIVYKKKTVITVVVEYS